MKVKKTEQNKTQQGKCALSYRIYDMKFIHFILFSSFIVYTVHTHSHTFTQFQESDTGTATLPLLLRKINSIGGREMEMMNGTHSYAQVKYTHTHTKYKGLKWNTGRLNTVRIFLRKC